MSDITLNENRAYASGWLVYINGLEVPVSAVSVGYGIGAVPEAEIVLVPDPVMQRFGAEDRVSVQVFYLDHWYDPKRPQFCLCFDGEVVAWSYVNTQRGRSISLTVHDYIQIFRQIFFFYMSNVNDLASGESARSAGVTINGVYTAGLATLFPYSLFAEGLISPTADGQTQSQAATALISRPIDYIYNAVRALIQSNVPNRSLPAGLFFAPWVKRTKFHNRFVALPYLERSDNPGVFPILRSVRATYALQAVQQLTSNIGSSGSIWDVFHEVLRTLMMELVMLPTAAAVQSDYASLDILGPPGSVTPTSPTFLGQYFVKPQFLFGLPPTCNVFFPSQVSYFSYQEDFATQPTRMYVNDESLATFLQSQNTSEGLSNVMRDALAVAYPEEVHQAMVEARQPGAHSKNGKNVLIYPEEYYRGPVVNRINAPLWFSLLQNAQNTLSDVGKLAPGEQERLLQTKPTNDEERNIYKKYAAYEHIKERYARRSAGVTLSGFNPYPVPGFPCAVFDRRSSQVDIFGYVTSVRHSFSIREMSTTVSVSYGRTFMESFSLLHNHVAAENKEIASGASAIERIGALAMMPAEPLQEVRDVVQNFDRAEQFYQALFHRQPGESANTLTTRQVQAELTRTNTGWADASNLVSQEPPFALPNTEPPKRAKPAVFRYPDIIQFMNDKGKRENLYIKGIDATARTTLLMTLSNMKTGTATDAEMKFLQSALQNSLLVKIEPLNPNVADQERIANAEKTLRGMKTDTNIVGGPEIVPRQEASDLFEKYDAAMRYNARPVCTLDEYIKFLGEDGVSEGRIEPGARLAANDPRTFAAPYYARIRRYTPGPPPEGSEKIEALPNTRTDWDQLLTIYRENVLSRIAPGR